MRRRRRDPDAFPRRSASVVVAAALAAVTLAPRSARGQAMHCDRSVVSIGDSASEVQKKCGPPTSRQHLSARAKTPSAESTPGRSRTASKTKKPASTRGAGAGREVWTYDLGSRQLVRYLTFQKGRLAQIDVGAFGR